MDSFANQASRDPDIKEALRTIEAWGLSPRFNKTSVSVFAQNGMLLIELHNKTQILFFAQEMGHISKPDTAGAPPDEPACSAIARLESELATERASRLKTARDADNLRQRVAELQAQLKNRQPAPPPWEKRFAKLKTFLARELHPDYFQGTGPEQKYRTELFKILWSRLEDIEKS